MNELELIVGARVYCRNGKFGRLAKIAVEPRQWRVTHIIVEEGFLKKRFRVLPISIVEQATTGDVYLGVSDEDLARFPEYVDGRVTGPLAGSDELVQQVNATEDPAFSSVHSNKNGRVKRREGLPEDVVVVERGTPIDNLDGSIGRLDYMLVSADDGQITGLVLQQRVIPNSMVQHIDEEHISVAAIPGDDNGTGF